MKKLLALFLILCTNLPVYSAGYMGTLPDVEAEFSYLRKQKSEKVAPEYTIEEIDKKSEKELKTIPRDNKNYVDIMVKREKTTQYMNDVNSVIIILEKLRKCLNKYGNIQNFNAIVSNLIDHVYYIQQEYSDKPEKEYLSYSKLIEIAAKARDAANFRMQCKVTEQYIPSTSEKNVYVDENLDIVLQKLLDDINDTLFVLKNLE